MDLTAFATDCQKTASAMRNMQPVYADCAKIVGKDMAQGVREGTAPDGNPFAPLAHSRPGGTGAGPLFDTGYMAATLEGGPDHVEYTTREGFVVGSRALGLRLMQDGGWVLPKRTTFLAIPATAEAKAAGSPLNFPRKLEPRIGVKGGVLIEPGIMGSVGVVQYYLSRGVYVPGRKPVGISDRAMKRVIARIEKHLLGGR
jgi:hypothetical protein